MWIKICGLTTAKTAHYCAVSGADAIGFVFAASKRKIAVTAARQIIEGLPPALEKVGVFVNAPHQEVAEIQHYLDLDVLQFHGAESPEYCSWFHSKVIKAFRISSAQDLLAIESYRGKIWACLLDSHIIGSDGGTGKPWDWSLFKTN
ncbi:MAG TPA: phosphoribosylanthranilate isomerase, partial [Candidatus Limnocylindrales bacterium]|nr:phosphoribosylanthranilate isomerase [Candidatus Limnocylindrales bacterium]